MYTHSLLFYMHGEEDINRMEDDFIESIRLISLDRNLTMQACDTHERLRGQRVDTMKGRPKVMEERSIMAVSSIVSTSDLAKVRWVHSQGKDGDMRPTFSIYGCRKGYMMVYRPGRMLLLVRCYPASFYLECFLLKIHLRV